jgi:hypothetical protein
MMIDGIKTNSQITIGFIDIGKFDSKQSMKKCSENVVFIDRVAINICFEEYLTMGEMKWTSINLPLK